MTDYPYIAPCSYFLIYVYEIPGSVDHAGILKVGDTSLKSPMKASELTVNCAELQAAARKRIDQQTGTAGVKYILHHAELAVRMTQDGGVKMITPFRDHDVHDVLEKSGYKHVKISGTKGREWYKTDLETVKKAIAAVKAGRIALDSSELKKPEPFVFREEQEKAINDTLVRFKKHNDMLWDAKMRFGKTPTALEVVRRGGFRKTIIITHRPVVGSSWQEDYHKIFDGSRIPYSYSDKTKVVAKGYEAKEEADKKDTLRRYDKAGSHFIYFASIQDLRGSKRVGGDFFKNDAVFDTAWDLVIVDEAHEGTQTELGKKVSDELIKSNKKTKVLSLSGTPFNLLPSFDDGAVFEWDYVKEQTAKTTWDEKHPNEPNPYAVLPRMNIYTFDLSNELSGYAEEELEGKAFNFTEFFRTWTGDRDADGRPMPKGVKPGDFIHAEDVRKFLDLLAKPSATSRYPFATAEYCDYFRHSLWMVPGVAAAKALSEMIHNHPLYKTFGVANVAGQGDDYEEEHEDNALELVRSTIRKYPRSITLSCGKLTTGVTVPEWTAVLMIAGSVHTAAASYMQTIFRVQSPWVHDGKVKEECYVFDFAPDRALTVIAETAQLSKCISKDKDKEAEGRRALGEFLNFCPVIALEGGKARQFEVNEMMRRLKHVFVMRAIRNGFDDPSIYDNEKLMSLGKLDLKKFNDLEAIVGKSKQTESTNDELAKRLLMVNAVAVSWANVVHAAERFAYNADAQGFLGKNRNELSNQGWQSVEKPLQKWVDWLICAEAVAVDELRSTLELFPTPIKIQTLTKIDIPAERIHVAAECGRVGFTPELYEQLKKAGKGGHMELAEAYPSEFIQACKTNSWEMLYEDLARIFTSERFSDGQKYDVAQMYESGVSDASVAKAVAAFLTKRNYKKMSEIVLEGVFPYLAQSDLQALILQRLNPASEKVKEMIPKMKTPYNAIFDDKCREQLPSTALNKSFVQFLIGKGLIAEKTTPGDNGNAKEK